MCTKHDLQCTHHCFPLYTVVLSVYTTSLHITSCEHGIIASRHSTTTSVHDITGSVHNTSTCVHVGVPSSLLRAALYKGGREESGAAGALQSTFVPAVAAFSGHDHDIIHFQFEFVFRIRRVGNYTAKSVTK